MLLILGNCNINGNFSTLHFKVNLIKRPEDLFIERLPQSGNLVPFSKKRQTSRRYFSRYELTADFYKWKATVAQTLEDS